MTVELNKRGDSGNPKLDPRLQAFHQLIIRHPKLDEMLDQVTLLLNNPEPYLLYMIGPTGVGKTTVRRIIHRRYHTRATNDAHYPDGWIPAAGYRTLPPSNGKYDPIANYRRGLAAMHEPLIGFKTSRPRTSMSPLKPGGNQHERDLRDSLVSAVRERHVELFWIDEAQHMAQSASGKSAYAQAEILKSLMDDMKIPVILFGHYNLRNLSEMTGQLIRRSRAIHFPRYRIDIGDEAKQFRNVLYTFQGKIPIPCTADLVSHLEACYQETLGCIGLLHGWIETALVQALTTDPDGSLTWSHFKASRRTQPERRQMLDEILRGEANFVTRADSTAEDDALMGLETFRLTKQDSTKPPSKPAAKLKNSRPQRRSRPGVSYPKRYRVGLHNWASHQ